MAFPRAVHVHRSRAVHHAHRRRGRMGFCSYGNVTAPICVVDPSRFVSFFMNTTCIATLRFLFLVALHCISVRVVILHHFLLFFIYAHMASFSLNHLEICHSMLPLSISVWTLQSQLEHYATFIPYAIHAPITLL